MIAPEGNPDNLILFPKTADYYKKMISDLLEQERYGETMQLLRQLLAQYPGTNETRVEWEGLLFYLQTMFPDGKPPQDVLEDDEETEETLFEADTKFRLEQDTSLADRLLSSFTEAVDLEKQLAVLERLRYVDDARVQPTILGWLRQQALPGTIQLRALQILRLRGDSGTAVLLKPDGSYAVEIEDTPLTSEKFPYPIQAVMERMNEVSEHDRPDLAVFAEQMWYEFVASTYGTARYNELSTLSDRHVDSWAAALHATLLDVTQGYVETEQLREWYAVTESLNESFHEACETLRHFTLSSRSN